MGGIGVNSLNVLIATGSHATIILYPEFLRIHLPSKRNKATKNAGNYVTRLFT